MLLAIRVLALLLAVLIAVIGLALVWTQQRDDHPCQSELADTMPPVKDAYPILQAYLEQNSLVAQLDAHEEGWSMLGAYPRANVLWIIRIQQPAITINDSRLQDVALAAYCLRSGWVWLNFSTPAGEQEFLSFSQGELSRLASR